MGEGRHARFRSARGWPRPAPSRSAATGGSRRRGGARRRDLPARAQRWNGTVEPRLRATPRSRAAPEEIELPGDGRPTTWRAVARRSSTRRLTAADRATSRRAGRVDPRPPRRSPLAVLADADADGSRCSLSSPTSAPSRRPSRSDPAASLCSPTHALERAPVSPTASHIVVARPAGRARQAAAWLRAPATPSWHGARLSYALPSRSMSWSTVFGLRLWPSTGT